MMMYRVVFWQNILSPHQAAHIRALAEHPACSEVVLVVEQEMSEHRRKLGWSVPEFGNTKVIVSPDVLTVRRLIDHNNAQSVHIFSGLRGTPLVRRALDLCLSTDAKIGIMSETGDWIGVKGLIRLLLAKADALKYRSRIDFILAMGSLGRQWFMRSGYHESKLFTYGYFVDRPKVEVIHRQQHKPHTTRLIFIGRNLPLKGVDTLLHALKSLEDQDWCLTVVGDGPAKTAWHLLVNRLGLAGRINFRPSMPNHDLMNLLQASDLLVLPSKGKEGWGAVVNEALMLGVPVICSSFCGAADLLGSLNRGEVFDAGSVTSLTKVLKRWISKGKASDAQREEIRKWSKAIEGEAAAQYLLEIISYTQDKGDLRERPVAPWLVH